QKRDAPDRREVVDKHADERLHLLVRNDRHFRPARVLQPGGEEVDALLGPVQKAHLDFAEVVLRKLPGRSLEARHQPGWLRTYRVDQLVERALAARVAV